MRHAVTPWLVLGLCLQWSAPVHATTGFSVVSATYANAQTQEPEPAGDVPAAPAESEPSTTDAPPAEDPADASTPGAAVATNGMAGVAVLPLLVSGELAEAANVALLERLRKGISRGSFFLIDQKLTDEIAATGCADDACYKRMTKEAKATYLVRTTISVADRDYQVKIDLVDVRTGNVVATSEEGCELCGVAEVGSVLEAQGAQLGKKLEDLVKEPPTLVVKTKPEGALVMIDGQVIGVSPVDRTMLSGKHVVRISYDGYIPEEREIESVVGVAESVDIELKRTPESKRFRALGWAGLGVGAATIIGGSVLMPLNGQIWFVDTCPNNNNQVNPDTSLPDNQRFPCYIRTTQVGAVMIGVGTALATAGVMALIRYSDRKGKARRKKNKSAKKAAFIRPTGLGLAGRF